MTIASQSTANCAPWCNDHHVSARGEDICNRLVAELAGGVPEYEEKLRDGRKDYVEITKAGDDVGVFWCRTECNNDVAYVRAFANALLVAADMIDSPHTTASPGDI